MFTTCSSSSSVCLLPLWVSRWVLSSSSVLLFPWVLLQILQIFLLQIIPLYFFFLRGFFYGTWVLETRIPGGKNLHVNNENSSLWGSSFVTKLDPLGLEMLLSLNCFKTLLTNEIISIYDARGQISPPLKNKPPHSKTNLEIKILIWRTKKSNLESKMLIWRTKKKKTLKQIPNSIVWEEEKDIEFTSEFLFFNVVLHTLPFLQINF